MNQLFATFLAFLLLAFQPSPVFAVESNLNELPKCIEVAHCVLETWEVNNVQDTFEKAVEAIEHMPRTKIVERMPLFVHAEAQTRWLRYKDDLLVKGLPERGEIQVRSESRVGIGDNGVNQRRVDELSYRLTTNQIN